MKKILLTFLAAATFQVAIGQTCSTIIAPHAPSSGGGVYHVFSDTTINDQDGSTYYFCSGINVTVNYSAGCVYQLEDNVTLTITDQEGDAIYAKGNCTITDNSSESIIVNKEASSTFSKPNNTPMGIVFTCSPMTFDYSAVGGSSPCLTSINENVLNKFEEITVYPNPVSSNGELRLGIEVNRVILRDLSGAKVVEYNNLTSDFIQLGNITSGFYLLVAESLSGQIYFSRLMVE